jgi:hypothetical protein
MRQRLKRYLVWALSVIFFFQTCYPVVFPSYARVPNNLPVPPPVPTLPAGATGLRFRVYVDDTLLGHVFVELEAHNSDGTLFFKQRYGFYPQAGSNGFPLPASLFAPGSLVDDGKSMDNGPRPWAWKITWDINATQWSLIQNWINSILNGSRTFYYSLFGYNCLNWAYDTAVTVAQVNGPPSYIFSFPPILDKLGVAEPLTLEASLASQGDGSTYWGGTINKNLNSNPAADPFYYAGSYELVAQQGWENPSNLSADLGDALITGSLGTWTSQVGQSVAFSSPVASLNLSQTEVTWNFGDGDVAYQNLSATETYGVAGIYTVTFLAVNDSTVWSYTETVTVTPPPPPPVAVTIWPTSVTMDVGQSQLFTSSVTGGTSPYSYQWYLNGTAVSGATGSTWTFAPLSSGSYTVYLQVTDAVGQVATSNNSPVTVNLLLGQSQLFTCPPVSGGTGPYSYQWYLNGAPVSGANDPTWTFTPTSAGSYMVSAVVTDSAGTQTTYNIASVTVVQNGGGCGSTYLSGRYLLC